MKKILYTLITALLLVSCHDDEMINNIPTPVEEGGQVTVTVGLDIPELQTAGSRALGEFDYSNAANLPLQLVVFDENGVLTEAKTGDDVKYVKTEGETVYFSVTLTVTNAKRYIHFILNSPATSYDWGTEDNLIGSLFVSGGQDAYWQRVEFPNGIEATATPDGKGGLTYTSTDNLIYRMTNVPMLRNFAKISVSTTDVDNELLTEVSYYVVNVWDAGTVAPYYSGDFTDFVNFDSDAPTRYMQITQKGYEGIEPSGAELIQEGPAMGETSWTVPDDAWLPVTQGTTVGTPFYMYERRNTFVSENVPSTYLLIKGKYKGSSQFSYYKLDLVYTVDNTTQQKQYYNILRNFHYAVNIQSVIGAGYGTAYEAATHAASNNLSGSIDLRDLTNISDSQDRLFVEYTDMTIVNNGSLETERTIKYKYIQGSQGDPITNANLTLRELTEDADDKRITDIYYKDTSGTDVYVYQDGAWVDDYTNNADIAIDSEDWSTLHIQFGGTPSNTVLTNTLGFYIGNLSREVDYHLRSIMPMIVECKPSKVPTGVKQSVAANILIPTGITGANDPYQLFPLEFWVEAEALTISPDVVSNEAAIKQSPYEMPVESGTSIIPSKAENNKQTFRYKRTITNEEYQSLPTKEVTVNYDMDGDGTAEAITETYRIIPCHFLTNTTNSASNVYAQNDYFTLIKVGNFVNGTQDIKNATLTDTGIYGVGQAATLSFTAVTPGIYTITSGNLSESSRIVSQEVTFKANESKTINLVTATWEKTSMVTITAPGETKSEYDVMAEARTILPMKATTTLNGVAFTTNPTFYVYTDKSSAMAMTDNKVTDVTNTVLTSANGTSKEIAGLKENTELWFAYQSGGFIYVASTTAGELAAKTAELAFIAYEKPLEWSAELTGEQYYGGLNLGGQQYPNAVKTVTLNFETTKIGEYTIVFKEGTYETEKTIDVTDVSVNQAVTYSTLTWSDAISATITYSNEESSYYGSTLDVTGDKRNVLWVKANSITGTNLGNNTTIKITENVITTETSWNNTTVLRETNANELRNGIEIPIDDLDWNKTLYLNYRYRPNRYTDYNYYRLNISAYQLTSNVNISGFQN